MKVLLGYHKKHNIWVGIGGHIEPNETPDSAVKREVKEEVDLDITLLGMPNQVYLEGDINRLAMPFYAETHSAGDHDHWCLFYIAEAMNPKKMKVNKDELNDARWFSENELYVPQIIVPTQSIAKLAFEEYRRIRHS
jgi:NADH pyrophosphatase NudC (nudix superfamily)